MTEEPKKECGNCGQWKERPIYKIARDNCLGWCKEFKIYTPKDEWFKECNERYVKKEVE